jgi:tetratricopeptide (TPR) repeat protein
MNESSSKATGQRLDSWKEIAAFFARDERTVKRWEKERNLPVHRVPGGGRGGVFAFTEELSAWLRSAQIGEAPSAEAEGQAGVRPPTEERSLQPTLPAAAPRTAAAVGAGASPLPRWAILACLMLAGVFVVYGFAWFFQVRSVQGHVLPDVSFRRYDPARREAEDLYLKGRYYWNKRTADDLVRAADYFSAATQRDPNYAQAFAGLADTYNLLREYSNMPPSQAFPLALNAAQKAVQLDDSLSDGHRALAFVEFNWNWDLAGAEREFRRAIELNPNDPVAHHWYATSLTALPRLSESVSEIEKARALDPSSRSIAADRALIYFVSGRDQQATEILQELEQTDPEFRSPHAYLQGIYWDQREYGKSLDEAEALARMFHDEKELAHVAEERERLKADGESAFLQGRLRDQLVEFRQGREDALAVAKTYEALGDNKKALEYLTKGYERHEPEVLYLRNAREFQALRDDPAFQNILQHVAAGGKEPL